MSIEMKCKNIDNEENIEEFTKTVKLNGPRFEIDGSWNSVFSTSWHRVGYVEKTKGLWLSIEADSKIFKLISKFDDLLEEYSASTSSTAKKLLGENVNGRYYVYPSIEYCKIFNSKKKEMKIHAMKGKTYEARFILSVLPIRKTSKDGYEQSRYKLICKQMQVRECEKFSSQEYDTCLFSD